MQDGVQNAIFNEVHRKQSGGKIVPNSKKNAEAFSKIHRKNLTLLERKGTLCPIDHLLLYIKQYRRPLILDDAILGGIRGQTSQIFYLQECT
jgi:hypothetical protein